jgi:hypothetical protein
MLEIKWENSNLSCRNTLKCSVTDVTGKGYDICEHLFLAHVYEFI